jgi:hypothetical protein
VPVPWQDAVIMDIAELRRKLEEEGVPPDVYDLDIEGMALPSERYCLRTEGKSRWLTYFSERGSRTAEHVWLSEDQACSYLLEVLVRENERRDRPIRGERESSA